MSSDLKRNTIISRIGAFMLALLMIVGTMVSEPLPVHAAGTEIGSSTAPYLDDLMGFSKDEVIAHLKSHEHDTFYLGTPYAHGSISEMGNDFFKAENVMLPGKSMNCTGFVCYVLKQIGATLEVIKPKDYLSGAHVTNASNWFRYIVREKNAKSYRFDSVQELLDSGLATKGDILYFEPMVWSGKTDCHIGFFWGDTPHEDKFWHSDHQGNRISNIQSKYPNCALYLFKLKDVPSTPPETKKGSLKLRKVSSQPSLSSGSSQYSLAGAEYEVRNSSGSVVGALTTNSDGSSNTLSDLEEGSYIIQETVAPAGYALDPEEYTVSVTGDNTTTFTAEDEVKYDPIQLLLRKESSNPAFRKSLGGAEFTCSYYDSITNDVSGLSPLKTWRFKTDEKGEIRFSNRYLIGGDEFYEDAYGNPVGLIGTYVFTETKAPDGYVLDSEPHYGWVKDEGSDAVLNTYNAPIVKNGLAVGLIEGMKTDQETNAPISGTTLGLFKDSGEVAVDAFGNEVKSVVTDGNGHYQFSNIPLGKYLVKELGVADGYVKEVIVKDAVLSKSGDKVNVSLQNQPQKGQFEILKKDQSTNAVLPNAEFNVRLVKSYQKGSTLKKGTVVDHLITNEKGVAQSKDLPLGMYELVETKTPIGYVAIKQPIQIELVADGLGGKLSSKAVLVKDLALAKKAGITFTISNKAQLGQLEVVKRDKETEALLQGASFEVRFVSTSQPGLKIKKGTVMDQLTTDSKGYAKSKALPLGIYDLVEVVTPTGYITNKKVYRVNIEADGSGNELTRKIVYSSSSKADEDKLSVKNDAQKMRFSLNKFDLISGSNAQGQRQFAGAEFDVRLVKSYQKGSTLKKGTVVDHLITNEKGVAQSKDLPLGMYDVIETKAPQGYDLNPVAIRIEGIADNAGGKYTSFVQQKTLNGKALLDAFNGKVHELNELNRINANGSKDYRTFEDGEIAKVSLKKTDNSTVYFYDLAKYGRIALTKHADGDQGDQAASESGSRLKEGGIAFEIKDHIGNVVDSIVTDSDGRGSSKWLPFGNYVVHQVTKKDGFVNVPDFSVNVSGDFAEYQYNLENYASLAWLKIVKIDQETKKEIPQKGVTFELYDQKGNKIVQTLRYPVTKEISQFVTDASGSVQLPERLREGTYYLKEVKAPKGYYLDPNGEKIPVVVKSDGSIETVAIKEVENQPQKGQLILHKTANMLSGLKKDKKDPTISVPEFTEKFLAGSEWDIIAAEDILSFDNQTILVKKGTVVDHLITTDNREVKSKLLPLGKYLLREVKTPRMFVKEKDDTSFELTPQASTVKVQSLIQKKHNVRKELSFEFTKQFEQSKAFTKTMKSTFGLYLKDDYHENGVTIKKDTLLQKATVIATVAEGKDYATVTGKFTDIPFDGLFYIKELEGSEGYLIDNEPRDITADFESSNEQKQSEVIVKPIKNDLVSIDLNVVKFEMGSDQKIPVEGAKYQLVAVDDNKGEMVIGQYVTDKNGIIRIDNLDTGKYYLEEIEATDGYLKDDNRTEVVIDGDGDGEKHLSVEDEKIPSIKTLLFDSLDKEKDLTANEDVKVIDVVTYKDLIVGKEYKLTGEILRKSDGKVIANGETIFKPTSRDGEVNVEFTLNTKEFVGEDIVATEKLFREGKELTQHINVNDEKQTIHIPSVRTHATDEDGLKEVDPLEKVVIQDKVTYANLLIGKEYTVHGTLMDKETGKPILVNGKTVTATKTFTADKADGEIIIEFVLDASALRGKSTVVFEDLYRGKKLVAFHKKLTDEDQTIRITNPSIKTKAFVDGNKKSIVGKGHKKVIDVVTYKDLIVGKSYSLSAKLVLQDDPTQVIAEKVFEFKPASRDGEVNVEFGEIDLSKYQGKKLVVVEQLLDEDGNVIYRHEELNDTDQTITIEEVPKEIPPIFSREFPPETGDREALVILTMAVSAGLGLYFVRKKRIAC